MYGLDSHGCKTIKDGMLSFKDTNGVIDGIFFNHLVTYAYKRHEW